MNLLQAVILGCVQGLTEFVPISSSAHLVLVPTALGWPSPPLAFDVMLHAASLLAVVAYFRREIGDLVIGSFRPGPGRKLLAILVVATIPAALAGLLFEESVERALDKPKLVCVFLIGTAGVLTLSEVISSRRRRDESAVRDQLAMSGVGFGAALSMGIAQAAAILPGLSRSGMTIGAGLVGGLDRNTAARFSFLMSIPVLTGASLVQLPELTRTNIPLTALVLGFIASLLTSYLSIAAMIGYLKRKGLYPFAIYCVLAGAAGLILLPP